jgi:SAM-dependent methyltransferase
MGSGHRVFGAASCTAKVFRLHHKDSGWSGGTLSIGPKVTPEIAAYGVALVKTTGGKHISATPLSLDQIQKKLSHDNLDELLRLWWAEQGSAKKRDLELIATALPFSPQRGLRVLDLCCGPGDVGRAIRSRFPKSRIDCVDRDLFLISICIGVNRREGISGRTFVRDLRSELWLRGLSREYDVVATANALHWFDARRAAGLFGEVFQHLRPGGVFLFAEPACVEKRFASAVAKWKAKQPARYSRENWERFWSRANQLLGYDHTKQLGPRDTGRIDEGMSVLGWIKLLKNSGFESIDVLLRDADEVILAGAKPQKSSPTSRCALVR